MSNTLGGTVSTATSGELPMRKKPYGTLKVRAISGTYVVFLAFDMKEADAAGLIGSAQFAPTLQRGIERRYFAGSGS